MDTCLYSFCHENANSVHAFERFQLMARLNIREPRKVLDCCPKTWLVSWPDQRINGLVAGLSVWLGEWLLIDKQRQSTFSFVCQDDHNGDCLQEAQKSYPWTKALFVLLFRKQGIFLCFWRNLSFPFGFKVYDLGTGLAKQEESSENQKKIYLFHLHCYKWQYGF